MMCPLDVMPISFISSSVRRSSLCPVMWFCIKTSAYRCISHSASPVLTQTGQGNTKIHFYMLHVPSNKIIYNENKTSHLAQKPVISRSAVKNKIVFKSKESLHQTVLFC